jgi:aminodeoxyfutalosine synthase
MSVSEIELATLASSHDIVSLGMMADDARRRRHGTRTTFVRVATTSAELHADIVCPPAAGELRIEGTPATARAAVERVREVVSAARGVPVSAFSLADLEQFATGGTLTLRALLEDLRAAGLELIAEAPVDRLKDARRSIEEVNIGGLALARLTVHRLPSTDMLPLFAHVAEVQRRVGVIRAFAPLARLTNPAVPTTGYDDVKRVALARIVVDNIPSIQVDWQLYGPKLAQVALTIGADDIDGVSADDDMTAGPRRAPLEEIRRNIRAAGFEPAERNGRFDLQAS